MLYLPSNPSMAPQRKFRGKGRYFRDIIRKAESFSITPRNGNWWEFWHYHADWPGWGNLGWKIRLEHLQALAIVFRQICRAKLEFTTPFQTWIHLDAADAGCDATFLHTPNGNRDNFPWKPIRVKESISKVDPVIQQLFSDVPIRMVFFNNAEPSSPPNASCIIYSPDIGVPLE
jgi:hypothetical protein